MLSFVDVPRTIEVIKSRKGKLAMKVVYFFGTDDSIHTVMKRRQEDKSCRQLPKKDTDIDHAYHVRVFYVVDSDGSFVHRIDVKIGNKWSCFFDKNNAKTGEHHFCQEHFLNHYLTTTDYVSGIIGVWEKNEAIKRLNHDGPEVFGEPEEPYEPDPPDALDDDMFRSL